MYRWNRPPHRPGSRPLLRPGYSAPIKRALLVTLAGLAVATPATAATHKRRPARCSLPGSKTLLATREARVFYRTSARTTTTSEYACLYARNKRFLLASGDSEPGGSGDTASLERLAGSYVAFVSGHFDDSQRYNTAFQGFPEYAEAINLSTGAVLRFRGGNITDLVLAADGSFAWITSAPAPAGYEVHRLNVGDAADTVLDSGQDIAPQSLALAGKTLYWTKAGTPATAPLR